MNEQVSRRVVVFPSELGWMAAAWADGLLVEVTFGRKSPQDALKALECGNGDTVEPNSQEKRLIARLQAYATGARDEFDDVSLDLSHLTDFQRRVIARCRRIPFGKTLTYAQLAAKAGSPRAARAVGNVMAANRFPLIVPCHRVVGSAGSLGGYSAPEGTRMKLRLLEQEGLPATRK
jgi:methylated-DNA-[protein]-cysteine S-methyltransferase